MKLSQFRRIIKEEVKRVLRENEQVALSELQVGDQFIVLEDAVVAPGVTTFFKKVSASTLSNIVFTVLEVTPTSVICTDGKFQGNSISSPIDLTRQSPDNTIYGDAKKVVKKLKAVPGTVTYPNTKDKTKYDPAPPDIRDFADNMLAVIFKPLKADPQVKKVGKLSA